MGMDSLAVLKWLRQHPESCGRPVLWRGTGRWVEYRDVGQERGFYSWPTNRGGHIFIVNEWLFEEWEIYDRRLAQIVSQEELEARIVKAPLGEPH